MFSGVKEGRKGSTAAAVLTIGNHLRILFFNFVVCVCLVFYLKCMIVQDEVDIGKVSYQIYHVVIFVYFRHSIPTLVSNIMPINNLSFECNALSASMITTVHWTESPYNITVKQIAFLLFYSV